MSELIDELPLQTISNVRDVLNLLRATDLEDLAERPAMGMQLLLSLADAALQHLEDNYRFESKLEAPK